MARTATGRRTAALLTLLLLVLPATAGAVWIPSAPVPVSAPHPAITVQIGAGADGTAAAVWSDGTTVLAAVKPAGSGTFGAPVAIGSGQAPDVAVSPAGTVLAVWEGPGGIRGADRAAGAAGFTDLGVVASEAGAANPQVAYFANGRAALVIQRTGGVSALLRPAAGGPFAPQFSSLGDVTGTVSGVGATVSDDAQQTNFAMTVKNGGASSVRAVAMEVGGGGSGSGFDSLTDTSNFPNSTSHNHSQPQVVADLRTVIVYVTQTTDSVLGFPNSQTTTLRSMIDPAGSAAVLGSVDTVTSGGFLGSLVASPALARRGDGTVTAVWAISNPIGGSLLRSADAAAAATVFGVKDDIEGYGGATAVGAPDVAPLPGAALVLVAADGGAVRAATSATGQPFGAPLDLVSGADAPTSAQVEGDGLGGLVAAWTQGEGANRRVYAQLYDDAPPAISNAVTPAALGAGQAGAFSATASDAWSGAVAEWDFGDGQTATGAQVSHTYSGGGVFAVTVRARDAAGNVSDRIERVVRVSGPPAGPGAPGGPGGPGGAAADRTAPVISGLSLLRRTFAVAAQRRRAVRVRRGTSVRFRLSEAASVTLTVTRTIRGHRSGSRCVARKPPGRTRARCTLRRRVGDALAAGRQGSNSVPFKGRVAGRPLARGSYRLSLVAVDSDGNRSRTVSTTFTIARAR
jgi:hypothetical protein